MFWRDGRVAEGAPLLREYGSKAHRGFKSHSLRFLLAPVAQLDRVSGYELEGRGFESLRARYLINWSLHCNVRWLII